MHKALLLHLILYQYIIRRTENDIGVYKVRNIFNIHSFFITVFKASNCLLYPGSLTSLIKKNQSIHKAGHQQVFISSLQKTNSFQSKPSQHLYKANLIS